MSSEEIPQAEAQMQEQNQQKQPEQEELSEQDQAAYRTMMANLSKMGKKIEAVKSKLTDQPMHERKNKTNEISDKLIQSKQSSEIVTKQNLLTDITESYEKVVIQVYTDNQKLKKKIEEMAKVIKQQNSKLYEHAKKQEQLKSQNQKLRQEIVKLKDQRLIGARQHVNGGKQKQKEKDVQKKKNNTQNSGQEEDYDFWSMPQNDLGKKKKDFVADSNLWVNQKGIGQSVFLTQQSNLKRKK